MESLSTEKKVEDSGRRCYVKAVVMVLGSLARQLRVTTLRSLGVCGAATLATSAWWTLAHNSLHITLCLAPSLYTLGSSRFGEVSGASCCSRGRTRSFFHLQSEPLSRSKRPLRCDGDLLKFIMHNTSTFVSVHDHHHQCSATPDG